MKIKTQIPEGYEIDSDKSTFECIILKKIKNKYPLSIEYVKDRNWYTGINGEIKKYNRDTTINHSSSEKREEAILALRQLTELRDECNRIDGGVKWDCERLNFIIHVYKNIIGVHGNYNIYTVLHFRKESTRDWFLKTHIKLIETAKEFL